MAEPQIFCAEWLDRTVTLFRPTSIDDGFATVEGVPQDLGGFRASKTDARDSERVAAAQQGSSLQSRFLTRSSALTRTITTSDQIECEGVRYQVTGVKEDPRFGRRVAIEISATTI